MLQLIRSHPSNESRSRAFGRPSKTLAVLELVLAQHLGRHSGPAVCLQTERERVNFFFFFHLFWKQIYSSSSNTHTRSRRPKITKEAGTCGIRQEDGKRKREREWKKKNFGRLMKKLGRENSRERMELRSCGWPTFSVRSLGPAVDALFDIWQLKRREGRGRGMKRGRRRRRVERSWSRGGELVASYRVSGHGYRGWESGPWAAYHGPSSRPKGSLLHFSRDNKYSSVSSSASYCARLAFKFSRNRRRRSGPNKREEWARVLSCPCRVLLHLQQPPYDGRN